MYHQVDCLSHKRTPMRGLVVAPRTFYYHMLTLKLLGFTGLSMRDLAPYLSGEKKGRVVGITFDDGYLNNLENALPVLKRFGFSSTCYVVTQFVGKFNAWDATEGVYLAQLMSRTHLERWISAGQDIGAHTRTHVDLRTSSDQQVVDEIEGSQHDLLNLFGKEYTQNFCYPYGRYDLRALDAVKNAGYSTATTTQRGRVNESDDNYRLPRILVSRTTMPLSLTAKLLTTYEDNRREQTRTTF
jgi:peptidoglycan/xylan/chitin deacetylase (PgdA/CDA1 family)